MRKIKAGDFVICDNIHARNFTRENLLGNIGKVIKILSDTYYIKWIKTNSKVDDGSFYKERFRRLTKDEYLMEML